MKRKNKIKGVSPIIAVILLVMIVVGMGMAAYFFFSKTQTTLQKGTEEQTEKTFQLMYTKIRIESITKDKIYIRNTGSFDIKKDSIQVYVNNDTYPFIITTDILEPNRVYAIQLSPPLNETEYLIKVTAGSGIEDSRYVNLATTTSTTSTIIIITTTTIPGPTTTTTTIPGPTTTTSTTTSTTTTTIPGVNNPPYVTNVAFSGSTTQGSKITLFVDATDPEDPSNLLNVNLWVGRCISTDCSSSSGYEWNLNGVAMAYVSGNRFEYNWTIPYPAGTVVGATAQATDTQGAQSNWGDAFPLFTVGNATTTTTSTTSTTTTTTSTTTTTTLPWYFSNLPRRRPITINNPGSTLTNFQVSLNITYDSDMTYNFADIRFTYYNGTSETQIPYWLESYQANSWAKVWVKVPRLNSGSNTVYVYYGNSTLSSASNFDQVFTKDFEDSGLIASWHFDEGSGTIVRDVSGNGNNGTIINPSLGTYWTSSDGGQWDGRSDVKFSTGSALNFTNSFSFVEVPNSASLNPTNEISIEAWVYPQAIMSGYRYRIPITVTNTGGSLSNYQVSVIVNTANLISAGKMRSDCGDIRFTDSDGTTQLSYWIESGCNSASTRIWVKIPSIPRTSTKIIYMYYGNPSATSASNGANTFDFFDDFDSFNTSRWYSVAGSSYSVSNSILTITQGAIGLISALPFNINNGYIVESRLRYQTNSEADYSGVLEIASSRFIASGNGNSDAVVLYMVDYPSGSTSVKAWVGNGASASYNIFNGVNIFSMSLNTWYILGIEATSSTVGLWKDYSRINSSSISWSKNLNYIALGYYIAQPNNIKDVAYDWVRVRKYRSPEPTTSLGNEQSSESQTTWLYRKPINITNPGDTLTNYETLVTVDTATLISEGKMRSDCGDIRFTDSDGTTWLEYYLEGGCNTNATQIWVKVPSIPSGTKVIYMYYGNPDAVSASLMWSGQYIVLSEVPCGTGWQRFSALDNRFPRGSATYGGTGGSETHTHTLGSGDSRWVDSYYCYFYVSSSSHSHPISTENHLPPYLNMIYCSSQNLYLRMFYITIFNTNPPSGWQRFSALDNRFPRGSATYGGTGGRETHTHTISPAPQTVCTHGSGTDYVSSSHTHSLSTENHLPPYIDVIFGQVLSDSPAPIGTIVMATSVPPMGWNRVAAFDNRFIRGSSTYGGTGGRETHSHTISQPSESRSAYSYTRRYASSPSHTHSVSTENHLPPYLNVVFIQKKSQAVSTSVGPEQMRFMINKGTAYGIGANTTHAFSMINNQKISAPLSSGWNHIVMTYDRNRQLLYINGIQSSLKTMSEQINQLQSPLIIFNFGILDEVKIYNRALSADEIRAHYERRKYTSASITYSIGNEETR